MKDKVLKTIEKYNLIQGGETVVVGISGGPDSVCLLHLLATLRTELGITLHAVHINHLLRGIEAEDDQRYVAELCTTLEVPLHVRSFDVKSLAREKGISLETAGREVRYSEFERFSGEIGATRIAVAHNKNDQAETVLMHILRGTGLEGLKGMDRLRGRIIRPLLEVGREEIEKYCAAHSLNPRIDPTNLESVFTRNKVRLDLVPYINRLFDTDIVESLNRMADLLADDQNYIEQAAANLYNSCILRKENNSVLLGLERFEACPDTMKKRVLRNAIKEVKGNLLGIESVHIEQLTDLYRQGRTGAELHLPQGVRVQKSYETLKFFIRTDPEPEVYFNKAVDMHGRTYVEELRAWLEAEIISQPEAVSRYSAGDQKSRIQLFDYEKLSKGINIRNRRDGDVFKPYRSNGTKKLKEFFIDNKIPKDKRSGLPLVAAGNEVVWVIGCKISDKFKVTENTKRVLKLTYKELE